MGRVLQEVQRLVLTNEGSKMYMAKAIAAFIGAVVTALLGLSVIPVTGAAHTWLTIIMALATAVMTYAVPNRTGVTSVVP